MGSVAPAGTTQLAKPQASTSLQEKQDGVFAFILHQFVCQPHSSSSLALSLRRWLLSHCLLSPHDPTALQDLKSHYPLLGFPVVVDSTRGGGRFQAVLHFFLFFLLTTPMHFLLKFRPMPLDVSCILSKTPPPAPESLMTFGGASCRCVVDLANRQSTRTVISKLQRPSPR